MSTFEKLAETLHFIEYTEEFVFVLISAKEKIFKNEPDDIKIDDGTERVSDEKEENEIDSDNCSLYDDASSGSDIEIISKIKISEQNVSFILEMLTNITFTFVL